MSPATLQEFADSLATPIPFLETSAKNATNVEQVCRDNDAAKSLNLQRNSPTSRRLF